MKYLNDSNIKTLNKIANGFGYTVCGTVRSRNGEMHESIRVHNTERDENSILLLARYDDTGTFVIGFAVVFLGFGMVSPDRENKIMKNLNNAYACVNVLNGLIGGLRNA